MRYNGEHQDKELCVQCAEDFVSLSDVILHATNMHSAGEAFRQMYASLKKVRVSRESELFYEWMGIVT